MSLTNLSANCPVAEGQPPVYIDFGVVPAGTDIRLTLSPVDEDGTAVTLTGYAVPDGSSTGLGIVADSTSLTGTATISGNTILVDIAADQTSGLTLPQRVRVFQLMTDGSSNDNYVGGYFSLRAIS